MLTELSPGEEFLTLHEAKIWLRIFGNQQDRDVTSAIVQARDYLERTAARTLRVQVQYQATLPVWPSAHGEVPGPEDRERYAERFSWSCRESRFYFPQPPYLDLDTCVQYYDRANTLSDLSTSRYRVIQSKTAQSHIELDVRSQSLPTLYYRDDAILVTWYGGYETAAAVEPSWLMILKAVLRAIFDGDLDQKTWELFDRQVLRVNDVQS